MKTFISFLVVSLFISSCDKTVLVKYEALFATDGGVIYLNENGGYDSIEFAGADWSAEIEVTKGSPVYLYAVTYGPEETKATIYVDDEILESETSTAIIELNGIAE